MADASRLKKVVFSAIILLAGFSILELEMRIFFSFKVGPSVLLYGTPFSRQEASGSARQGQDSMPEAKIFRNPRRDGCNFQN